MKDSSKKLSFIGASVISILVLLCIGCVLFVMFSSPYTRPSETVKMGMCKQRMEAFLSITNQLESVQEAADILRQIDDPWGHKFNVVVADNFASASFGRTSGGIIMWSSGPNGINENGLGDDIIAEDEIAVPDGKVSILDTSK